MAAAAVAHRQLPPAALSVEAPFPRLPADTDVISAEAAAAAPALSPIPAPIPASASVPASTATPPNTDTLTPVSTTPSPSSSSSTTSASKVSPPSSLPSSSPDIPSYPLLTLPAFLPASPSRLRSSAPSAVPFSTPSLSAPDAPPVTSQDAGNVPPPKQSRDRLLHRPLRPLRLRSQLGLRPLSLSSLPSLPSLSSAEPRRSPGGTQNQSGWLSPSARDREEDAAAADQVDRADASDNGRHETATGTVSVASQALAWDQTCLRIAYLVSTMVTPTRTTSGADAIGQSEGAGLRGTGTGFGTGEGRRNPAAMPTAGELEAIAALDIASASHSAAASAAATARYDCPGGWPGTPPPKKRRKIAMILAWQNEVAVCGAKAQCGCSAAFDAVAAAAAAGAALGARPALSAESSRSSQSTPSYKSAQSAPHTTAASLDGLAITPADYDTTAPCQRCHCPQTPPRTIRWVGPVACDKTRFRWHGHGGKSRQSIRRAFRSLRGLISSGGGSGSGGGNGGGNGGAHGGSGVAKKHDSGGRAPSKNSLDHSPQRKPSSLPRSKEEQKLWDEWDELNCQELAKTDNGEFFTETDMYKVHVSGATTPTTDTTPAPKPLAGVANKGQMLQGSRHPSANNNDADAGSSGSSTTAKHDPAALARRRQRQAEARLRRAQKLLTESHGVHAGTGILPESVALAA